MKRGSIVIAGERGAFTGKPRPWLVLQNSAFLDEPSSVTVCAISTTADGALFRVTVRPDADNNLRETSIILLDKVITLRAAAIDHVAGMLDGGTMARVDDALRLWLDL